ncbi:sigma-70 family RNA polymerase sigma factor [Yinghuangia soli]|uniref:RNA polymerase sigma factor n=1 Tax=Yinghuangia soli TaxID=2908204 RepID=A0AA41PZA3_9ACTN|nr:sigma-70 family RNA polymerase sigma factor [Yinghuangia soli]MCF2528416.1 sigma-70 family RNA polymerase sigma factor [Yinghuangia soli]
MAPTDTRPDDVADPALDLDLDLDLGLAPGPGLADPSSDPAAEFTRRTDPHRRELLAYCYRMLGSAHDAEDLVQDTFLRVWRAYDRYDPQRASMRTWLYRIATNVCLTALESRTRRPLPSGLGAPDDDPLTPLEFAPEVPWIQPIPDAWLADPGQVVAARGSLRLAWVAAVQYLPARQRAVLILRDVLEWSAAETAALLETTPAAVNSALQRARARLAGSGLAETRIAEEPADRRVVDRYAAAFEKADIEALTALLAHDAILEMPPVSTWFIGRERYAGFMAWVYDANGTDWQVLRTAANGQPAIAAYVRRTSPAPDLGLSPGLSPDAVSEAATYKLHTLQVFDLIAGRITRNTVFQSPEVLASFGLPETLPPAS